MLMQGDLNKVLKEVNKILEGAFSRIEALEDRLMRLEGAEKATKVPKSVNKAKKVA